MRREARKLLPSTTETLASDTTKKMSKCLSAMCSTILQRLNGQIKELYLIVPALLWFLMNSLLRLEGIHIYNLYLFVRRFKKDAQGHFAKIGIWHLALSVFLEMSNSRFHKVIAEIEILSPNLNSRSIESSRVIESIRE